MEDGWREVAKRVWLWVWPVLVLLALLAAERAGIWLESAAMRSTWSHAMGRQAGLCALVALVLALASIGPQFGAPRESLVSAGELDGEPEVGLSSLRSAFEDEDEDEGEEMDASASQEQPDNGGDPFDAYGDPEGFESSWLARVLEGGRGRRVGRDLDDQVQRRRKQSSARRQGAQGRQRAAKRADEQEFGADDQDEDAWVHDGVDDIQIDPETRRAASRLSFHERGMDADYPAQPANRTRITTITEVIPVAEAAEPDGDDQDEPEEPPAG